MAPKPGSLQICGCRKSGALKSLHLFCGRRHLCQAVRFDLSPPSRQEIRTSVTDKMGSDLESRYILHSMPLYAVEKLPELLKKFGLKENRVPCID
jgi:hypothetical protein